MKNRVLWIWWILMYGICAGLSHITDPQGNQVWALPVLAVLFFVPGVLLLIEALRGDDKKTLKLLRWISGLSVGLTVALFVANVLSALGGEGLGVVLHELLLFASVPMFCMGTWYVGLFFWCCIFFTTLQKPVK